MSPLLTVLATYGVLLLSAVVPFVNAELYLIAAAALAPRDLLVPLIVAATLGQMTGKLLMYYAGRGAVHLPSARVRRAIATVRTRYADRSALGDLTILASASVGLPPFYVVSIAAGMLGIHVARFAALGTVGRAARFAAIVLAPQLFR
jgi:membrane protein YqaA with SNARE-associated domain